MMENAAAAAAVVAAVAVAAAAVVRFATARGETKQCKNTKRRVTRSV